MDLPDQYRGKWYAVLMQIRTASGTGFYAGIVHQESPKPEPLGRSVIENYWLYEGINGEFVAILDRAAIQLTTGELRMGELERFLARHALDNRA